MPVRRSSSSSNNTHAAHSTGRHAPSNRAIGSQIETLAESFLASKGLTPHQQNQYFRGGEIDLIMWDQQVLVFIEVRYRKSPLYGSALESITPTKQARLYQTAERYLQRTFGDQLPDCRFDVVTGSGTPPVLEWISDAF